MQVHTHLSADPPFALAGDIRGAQSFETALVSHREPAAYEIDALGHVNNVVYLAWAQEIGHAHWRAATSDQLFQSYLWVGLHHDISYQGEIRAGDAVELRTWLAKPEGARMARHVDVRKAGEASHAARIVSDWCLIDAASRKPRRVTGTVAEAFGWE